MEISLTHVLGWVAALGVASYVKYAHSRMKTIEQAHSGLAEKFATFLGVLPEKYIAKDDYRNDVAEIKDTLRELRADVKLAIAAKER